MIRVGFVLEHFAPGGVERVVLYLLTRLDRTRFAPCLLLQRQVGAFLDFVPPDVPVVTLGGARARALVPALAGALRRERLAVAVSATTALNLALILAARLAPRPPRVVIGEHTPPAFAIDAHKWPRWRHQLMRHLYPLAARLVVPAAALAQAYTAALGGARLPLVVLANPLFDLAALRLTPPAPPAPPAYYSALTRPLALGVGRLAPEKGFDLLCRVWPLVRCSLPDAQLVLLGEGPERARLTALAAELGEAASIRLAGGVADPWPYLTHADVLVSSSRLEGHPAVLAEAMAAGTPVVAVDCPVGPRDVTASGRAGLLVPEGDPQALADAIVRVCTDAALRAMLIQRGRARAAAFDLTPAVGAYEAMFAALVAMPGR